MSTVTPNEQPRESKPQNRRRRDPERLPLRWAVIGLLTVVGAAVGYVVGGPVAAITAGCAVATAAHRLIA